VCQTELSLGCTQPSLFHLFSFLLLSVSNIPLLLICTLFIHEHKFTLKHLCWQSITKILRNGPRAHFPFRLLCVDLGAEAAAARAEAQRQQLELGQVIGERDQSRGRAAEAESRAEALGAQLAEASAWARAFAADLVVAQAASSEQRARAEGMSWLF
jgi:hypothetical protein